MNNSQTRKAILAVAVLVLGLVTAVGAAAAQQGAEGEIVVTLVGVLSIDGSGGYILVEQQSGDSIILRGPDALAEHVGDMVRVTGSWVDEPDVSYFEVMSIEVA